MAAAKLPGYRTDANGIRWSDIAPYQAAGLESPAYPWFRVADFARTSPGEIWNGDREALYEPGTWLVVNPSRFAEPIGSALFPAWQWTDQGAIYLANDGRISDVPFNGDVSARIGYKVYPNFENHNAGLYGDFQKSALPDVFILGIKTGEKIRTDVAYFPVGEWYVPYIYQPRQTVWNTQDGSLIALVSFVVTAFAIYYGAVAGNVWQMVSPVVSPVASQVTGNPYIGTVIGMGVNVTRGLGDWTEFFDVTPVVSDAAEYVPFEANYPVDIYDPGSADVLWQPDTYEPFEANYPVDFSVSEYVPFEANYPVDIETASAVIDIPRVYSFEQASESIREITGTDTGTFDTALNNLNVATKVIAQETSSFDLGKFVLSLANLYTTYRLKSQELSSTGRSIAPTIPTSGQTRVLPDGTTVRVNADGSSTVRRADGSGYLVRPDGTIVQAAAGSLVSPSIFSNPAFVAVGVIGIGAAVLLIRKRKGKK